ncbi:MAG: trigger factor [Oscillospiraceae bacterium]|jgi:trigger factor|nr:trigger factor [Oscillospiraceae bacterium]
MSLKNKENTETNTFVLEVDVDKETFQNEINKIYKKQIGKMNIPGFRRGKAPRHMVESLYGKDVFYDDAMQELYPEALAQAGEEAEIKIVSVENIEIIEVGNDGFSFKATVIVEPELTVENYKGIEVTKKSTEVTDELLQEEIDKELDKVSRMAAVTDRPAQDGDTVVIDFDGYVDDVAFDGGKAENHNLLLGSGQFIPGFEEQIVGHNVDDEFSVMVKFPEEYHAEALAGKDAEFKVKLHEIKAKELPAFDDDFVKDVSDKETVDEYKADLKEKLQSKLDKEAESDIENQIVTKLCELAQGEIPDAMTHNEVHAMIHEFEHRLSSQGLDLKTYLGFMGTDEKGLHDMYKPEAEKRVKVRLALEAVVRAEDIQITEEDLEAEYKNMAEKYKVELEQIKSIVAAENLTQDLKVQKAVELIKEAAIIK